MTRRSSPPNRFGAAGPVVRSPSASAARDSPAGHPSVRRRRVSTPSRSSSSPASLRSNPASLLSMARSRGPSSVTSRCSRNRAIGRASRLRDARASVTSGTEVTDNCAQRRGVMEQMEIVENEDEATGPPFGAQPSRARGRPLSTGARRGCRVRRRRPTRRAGDRARPTPEAARSCRSRRAPPGRPAEASPDPEADARAGAAGHSRDTRVGGWATARGRPSRGSGRRLG